MLKICALQRTVKRMKKIRLQSWKKYLQTTYPKPKSVSIIDKESSELNSKMEKPIRKLKLKNNGNEM